MSNREIVIELVSKLPEDTPLEEIAHEIELLAGIQVAREQARSGEGIPAGEAAECSEKDPRLLAALDEAVAKANSTPGQGHSASAVRARLSEWISG